MATQDVARPSRPTASGADGAATRTANTESWPVVLCASVGAVMLAFSLVVWGKWILSDDFGPIDTGSDPISTPALLALRGLELSGVGLTVWIIWRYLVVPRRQTGRLSGDGLMILAAPFVWFWDPFFNYIQNWFTYNAHLLNVGSWSSQVPGWVSPHQDQFVEPFSVGLSYVFWVFGFMLLGAKIFDRLRGRNPQMSTARFLVTAYLICAALNTVGEATGLLIGWFSYPGAWDELSLFSDTRWKFSVLSPLVGGLQLFLWVGLRYSRNAEGLTLVERGANTLQISERARSFVRFLALYTGLTAAVFVVNLGLSWHATHSGNWPKDTPSYLTTTCPEHQVNSAACGGPGGPIARDD